MNGDESSTLLLTPHTVYGCGVGVVSPLFGEIDLYYDIASLRLTATDNAV